MVQPLWQAHHVSVNKILPKLCNPNRLTGPLKREATQESRREKLRGKDKYSVGAAAELEGVIG